MAGLAVLVRVTGELREVRPRPITDTESGEIRRAATALILTEVGDEAGGFAEVYVDPDSLHALPAPDDVKGSPVDIVCRAYAVTRNYGTEDRPKFGKALGLSFVSGSFAVRSLHAAAAS